MANKTYSEKLKDQRWQKKRLQLLDAAGWKCQCDMCSNSDPKPQLQVHHKLYLRNVDPWDYEDWAYIVVCEPCHDTLGKMMETASVLIAKNQDWLYLFSHCERQDDALVQRLIDCVSSMACWSPEVFGEILPVFENAAEICSYTFTQGMRFKESLIFESASKKIKENLCRKDS